MNTTFTGIIRPYQPQDTEHLAGVYRDAVRTTGAQAYGEEQVRVWALYPDDLQEFQTRLLRGVTLVAEEAGCIAAFGQLEPSDHLAFLYCAGRHGRRGIGSAIYLALEARAFEQGVARIHTDASRISRAFFAKHGFEVIGEERVDRCGVEFERFRMVKPNVGWSLRNEG
ncbi:MAG: GNAT family N-acetyltransferase [Verrucomicrobiia bacterium]